MQQKNLPISERTALAIASMLGLLASAWIPALKESEADLIEAFKWIAIFAITGGSLEKLAVILVPIFYRIVTRTPDKRDDFWFHLGLTLLQQLGIKVQLPDEPIPVPEDAPDVTAQPVG